MATRPLVLSGIQIKNNSNKEKFLDSFLFPKKTYDEGDIYAPILENLIIAGYTLNHPAKCCLLRQQLARRALPTKCKFCLSNGPIQSGPRSVATPVV